MEQQKCKTCAKFRRFYYKGRGRLMRSGTGRCRNTPYNLTTGRKA